MAINMGEHSGSNFWTAEKIGPNKKVQFDIFEVYLHTFDDGSCKPVCVGADGTKVVLNPTRAKVLMAVWGPNSDNYVGRSIYLYQGDTTWNNKPAKCVAIEPILHAQIENKKNSRRTSRDD
jgi:hypothetical protein